MGQASRCVAIFPGRAGITLNQGQITPLGPDASGCFYGVFHHRPSRRLCGGFKWDRAERKFHRPPPCRMAGVCIALLVYGGFQGLFEAHGREASQF